LDKNFFLSFRAWIKAFHDILKKTAFSLFVLFRWSLSSVPSLVSPAA
jgi:hypothetical protein